jgi:general secretion pathway protein D
LNEIFTGAQPSDKAAKVSPGNKSVEVTNKQSADNKAETKAASAKRRRTSKSTGTGTATVADIEDVRIISDKANNSLIIVATPGEYQVILPIIKQLDILPLQVLIDATIVSVKLTDNLKYGLEWYLKQGNTAVGSGLGEVTLGNTAAVAATAFATGGLSLVQNSGTVQAILHAQADEGNVNVISSPSLMVLNNQPAKINIGDQVPIQTSTSSLPVASGATPSIALGSSIQYMDTGVTLDVTPRVNANGMVIMEIKQIVSTPVATSTGVSTSPTIQKKEIESSIAVIDGETIVLGGLIDDNNTETKNGIPFLNELPGIGPLFGSTTFVRTKNELVVLITPRVVKSKQDSRLISDEFKRKLTGIYESAPVVSGDAVVE